MERRTRQRQGARWQTKEKRERRGAQRAQGEEGERAGGERGAPSPGRERRIPRKPKGEAAPAGAHLDREISISRVIRAPRRAGTPGERGRIPPHRHPGWLRAGVVGFFQELKFGRGWCRRRRIKIPLGCIPPPRAGPPDPAPPRRSAGGKALWAGAGAAPGGAETPALRRAPGGPRGAARRACASRLGSQRGTFGEGEATPAGWAAGGEPAPPLLCPNAPCHRREGEVRKRIK